MVTAGVNYGLDLAADIAELKRERNAVILAHNYQVRELQEIADFVGDSLGLSYVICTSGNAERIVKSAPPDRNILFVPDQNLGAWVMEKTGRKMDLWRGTCYVHVEFTARSIRKIREQHPGAPLVAHPECTYAVRMLADEVCSTEKMVTFGKESPAREIIVVTEAGLLHRLGKEIPGKTFIPGPTDNCFCGECRFMKMNTLEKAYDALLNMEPEITLPEPVRKSAEIPILRMLELSK